MAFSKGDIVRTKPGNRHHKKLKHPAIVWEYTDDESNFTAVMLTHAGTERYFDNIAMEAVHFVQGMEVTYLNTHFVNQIFVKPQAWGPFYKAGALTDEGLEFIEQNLTKIDPMPFDSYRE